MKTDLRGALLSLLEGRFRFYARPLGTFAGVALAAAAASGCTTASASRSGDALEPTGAALYIAALKGGLVGRIAGADLSKADTQRALEAEYRALEAAPGGQPVAWQGRERSGIVVAAAPYQVGSQNCRQYSHAVTVGAREASSRGTACRNADGSWTPLS